MEHRGAGLNTGTRGLRLEPMYLGLTTEIALVLLNDYKKNHYPLLNVFIVQTIYRKRSKLNPKSQIQFLYSFAIWV